MPSSREFSLYRTPSCRTGEAKETKGTAKHLHHVYSDRGTVHFGKSSHSNSNRAPQLRQFPGIVQYCSSTIYTVYTNRIETSSGEGSRNVWVHRHCIMRVVDTLLAAANDDLVAVITAVAPYHTSTFQPNDHGVSGQHGISNVGHSSSADRSTSG